MCWAAVRLNVRSIEEEIKYLSEDHHRDRRIECFNKANKPSAICEIRLG